MLSGREFNMLYKRLHMISLNKDMENDGFKFKLGLNKTKIPGFKFYADAEYMMRPDHIWYCVIEIPDNASVTVCPFIMQTNKIILLRLESMALHWESHYNSMISRCDNKNIIINLFRSYPSRFVENKLVELICGDPMIIQFVTESISSVLCKSILRNPTIIAHLGKNHMSFDVSLVVCEAIRLDKLVISMINYCTPEISVEIVKEIRKDYETIKLVHRMTLEISLGVIKIMQKDMKIIGFLEERHMTKHIVREIVGMIDDHAKDIAGMLCVHNVTHEISLAIRGILWKDCSILEELDLDVVTDVIKEEIALVMDSNREILKYLQSFHIEGKIEEVLCEMIASEEDHKIMKYLRPEHVTRKVGNILIKIIEKNKDMTKLFDLMWLEGIIERCDKLSGRND